MWPDSGRPVPLVSVTADGVPRFGVVSVGDVAKTVAPVPVSSVNAAARLALVGVARNVAIPVNTVVSPVLQTGVLVSGNVRKFDGTPVASVDIDAVRAASGVEVPLVGDFTDAAGNFSTVVAPDTYRFQIKPHVALGLVAQQLANTVITTTTTLPQVTLQAGISVTGTVIDFVGTAIERTAIQVKVAGTSQIVFTPQVTDIGGHYTIVVPAGTYDFTFTPDPTTIVTPPVVLSNLTIGNFQHVVNCRYANNATTDAGNPRTAALSTPAVLHPNEPNPFNPTTTIAFELRDPERVRLDVFDARGRRVRNLVAGALDRGSHRVTWDGRDEHGMPVASGDYVYRLQSPQITEARRMVLVR